MKYQPKCTCTHCEFARKVNADARIKAMRCLLATCKGGGEGNKKDCDLIRHHIQVRKYELMKEHYG